MNEARVRELVARAIDAIVAGERADRVLKRTLRAHRDLTSEERARVATWTLGIALWRGRLDVMARGDRALWLALFLVDRERWTVADAARQGDVSRVGLEQALYLPEPGTIVERLAFARSLPLWLAQRWVDLWGVERADRLAAAMNERGPIALRVNTSRTTSEALLERLRGEGVRSRRSTLVASGVIAEGQPNIVGLETWRAGWFEVQDEGSQLIAAAADVRPGQLVVDLCAGSGGKTLALAAALGNDGRIVAVDVDAQRLVDLRVRARRNGATCIEPRVGDARDPMVTNDLVGRADVVLVDAPCSASGVLRRGPDARWRMKPDDAASWVNVQAALLHVGSRLVTPGGRLVYATCSLDPVENEQVARTLPLADWVSIEERTVAPDTDGCDGFYWAVWTRRRPS